MLADELNQLGLNEVHPGRGGVRFNGSVTDAMRVCLWSRVATRVLLPIAHFSAITPEELYAGTKAVDWSKHFDHHGSFAISAKLSKSRLHHSRYALQTVKDAIVDQFRERTGERPNVERDRPDVQINLYVHQDQASLSIDLSGDSLHRRGYRVSQGAAPLKENLAAAILLRAGWVDIAAAKGTLFDPLCGSATLLIEGAMMAADVAPGLSRDYFGFKGWKPFDQPGWEALLDEANERRQKGLEQLPLIVGSDWEPELIKSAKANIAAAGLAAHIDVRSLPLGKVTPAAGWTPGLFVCNPPYGERIGEEESLVGLYQDIGRVLKAGFQGWFASVFTGNTRLAFQIPLRSHKSYQLFNGTLACKLFNFEVKPERYFIPREGQLTAASSVYGGGKTADHALLPAQGPWSAGAEMLANRLRKNIKNIGRWAKRSQITCYRVYDADLPEYALAIDLYQGDQRWLHVQEYQAPKTIDPEKARQRLRDALAVLPVIFELPQERIALKLRHQQRGTQQYEKLDTQGGFFEVRENNARYRVNLNDYLDTGLFLDHRIVRGLMGERAQGKRFLNLFCYTGSATVTAALGGATATTSVDMSKTYLDWCGKNLALNGLDTQDHEMILANCVSWIKTAKWLRQEFDLIFLDPPTFSNSKSMDDVFDIQRDHVELINGVLDLLAPQGMLIFSTNFRKFKMDQPALNAKNINDISRKTLSKDFTRNSRIHYCWEISR